VKLFVSVQQRYVGTKPVLILVKALRKRAVMDLLLDIRITARVVQRPAVEQILFGLGPAERSAAPAAMR
jgi:hypothetical protein